jgi:hypothetical protein
MFFPAFRQSLNGGWLIASGNHLMRYRDRLMLERLPYKRMTFGGSVVRRVFPVRKTDDGELAISHADCFSDEQIVPDLRP